VSPELTNDRDTADRSPESLLRFLAEHKEQSRHTVSSPVRRPPRGNIVVLLGVVAALGLVAAGAVLSGGFTHRPFASHNGASDTLASGHHARPHPAPAYVGHSNRPKAKPVQAPQSMRVVLTAARGDCWVQIRKGGPTGSVVFAGVVVEGKSIQVVGRHFWARFGSLGNLDLTIDGRPVHPAFSGTVDAVIAGSTIRPAKTASG
jgi:Domain of unknown function (DUF4115)